MSNFYDTERESNPVCEERHYWHKRFNFASWLFLIIALFAIFSDSGGRSVVVGLVASAGFNVFDSWMQIRHLKWHIENFEGEDDDGNI